MKIDNCNKIVDIRVVDANTIVTPLSRPTILKQWILKARNALKIDFVGVNNIVYNTDLNKIVFVSGYTSERGLFYKFY